MRKILVYVGFEEESESDKIFAFTNEFIIEATKQDLPASFILSAINHLQKLGIKGDFVPTAEQKISAANETIPILNAECIIEYDRALGLQTSVD